MGFVALSHCFVARFRSKKESIFIMFCGARAALPIAFTISKKNRCYQRATFLSWAETTDQYNKIHIDL
jgi:hypothetical protein